MATITSAGRETPLYMHAVASAVACASQGLVPVLDAVTEREPSPAAQRVRVLEKLDAMLTDLDAVIRSKKAPPAGVPVATLGRRLIERGEKYDAVARTYTPGPGFDTLFKSLVTDSLTEQVAEGMTTGKLQV